MIFKYNKKKLTNQNLNNLKFLECISLENASQAKYVKT